MKSKTRRRKEACFAIVCFMKMNAPISNTFSEIDERYPPQDLAEALSYVYIILLILSVFKWKKSILSFLDRQNDKLHNF